MEPRVAAPVTFLSEPVPKRARSLRPSLTARPISPRPPRRAATTQRAAGVARGPPTAKPYGLRVRAEPRSLEAMVAPKTRLEPLRRGTTTTGPLAPTAGALVAKATRGCAQVEANVGVDATPVPLTETVPLDTTPRGAGFPSAPSQPRPAIRTAAAAADGATVEAAADTADETRELPGAAPGSAGTPR